MWGVIFSLTSDQGFAFATGGLYTVSYHGGPRDYENWYYCTILWFIFEPKGLSMKNLICTKHHLNVALYQIASFQYYPSKNDSLRAWFWWIQMPLGLIDLWQKYQNLSLILFPSGCLRFKLKLYRWSSDIRRSTQNGRYLVNDISNIVSWMSFIALRFRFHWNVLWRFQLTQQFIIGSYHGYAFNMPKTPLP